MMEIDFMRLTPGRRHLQQGLPDGTHEASNPTHSWNSAHWFSNAQLFKPQRTAACHWIDTRRIDRE